MPIRIPEKPILIPLKAGLAIMERYDLFCENGARWDDPLLEECAERVLTAHMPYEMEIEGKKCRINLASPNEEFRKKSLEALEDYVRGVSRAPNCMAVVSHPAPHFWSEDAGEKCEVREVGEYGHLIESLKHLSRLAQETGVVFVVENNRCPWSDIPLEEEFDHEKHHGKVHEYFATSPHEWARLPEDVGEVAFGLCLDTSHAVTYAQRFPLAARQGILDLYLDLSNDRLWHVHWNDNFLETKKGRDDAHITLGKGSLSQEYHRAVWETPSVKTWMLEHWTDENDLAFERRLIERL